MASTEHKFLSIAEKRAWLARIFRDASGYYSDADKFKALREDTLLARLYMQGDQPKPTSPNQTDENTETYPMAVDN